jgi:hypothetical protein
MRSRNHGILAVGLIASVSPFDIRPETSRKPHMKSTPIQFGHLLLGAVAALMLFSSAQAAGSISSSQAQANYAREIAVCNSGQSNQTLETCRREAGSALAEAKRGQLNDAPDQYQTNALRRCETHTGDDRQACEARILGQGDITSGTQAGGVLRKSITVTPGQ